MTDTEKRAYELCKEMNRMFDELHQLSKQFVEEGNIRMKFRCFKAMDSLDNAMRELGR